jgi:hypothetical protein
LAGRRRLTSCSISSRIAAGFFTTTASGSRSRRSYSWPSVRTSGWSLRASPVPLAHPCTARRGGYGSSPATSTAPGIVDTFDNHTCGPVAAELSFDPTLRRGALDHRPRATRADRQSRSRKPRAHLNRRSLAKLHRPTVRVLLCDRHSNRAGCSVTDCRSVQTCEP